MDEDKYNKEFIDSYFQFGKDSTVENHLNRLLTFKLNGVRNLYLGIKKQELAGIQYNSRDSYYSSSNDEVFKLDVIPTQVDHILSFYEILERGGSVENTVDSLENEHWANISGNRLPERYVEKQLKEFSKKENDQLAGNRYFEHGYEMFFEVEAFGLSNEVCSSILSDAANQDYKFIVDIENDIKAVKTGYVYASQYVFFLNQKQRLDRGEDIKKPESEVSQVEIQTTPSNIKLTWNGNNRALYDIFAQLKLMSVDKSDKTHLSDSWETIALFINQSFEGMPTPKTIKRELEKQYQNYGIERVKKGRIEIERT